MALTKIYGYLSAYISILLVFLLLCSPRSFSGCWK